MCYLAGMEFAEMIAQLRAPGDDGVPDTIYDDLSSSYQLAIDGGMASVAERDATIADLSAQVASLKALNFDLLMAAGAENTDGDDNGSDDGPDTDAVPTIDGLFTN